MKNLEEFTEKYIKTPLSKMFGEAVKEKSNDVPKIGKQSGQEKGKDENLFNDVSETGKQSGEENQIRSRC